MNHTILWGKLIFFGDPWGQMMHLPPPSDISYPPTSMEVLIDEASQATEPATIGAYLSWLQTVGALCEIHCQLPPTVKSDKEHSNALKTSLFERLALSGVQPIMLNIQYLGLQKNDSA